MTSCAMQRDIHRPSRMHVYTPIHFSSLNMDSNRSRIVQSLKNGRSRFFFLFLVSTFFSFLLPFIIVLFISLYRRAVPSTRRTYPTRSIYEYTLYAYTPGTTYTVCIQSLFRRRRIAQRVDTTRSVPIRTSVVGIRNRRRDQVEREPESCSKNGLPPAPTLDRLLSAITTRRANGARKKKHTHRRSPPTTNRNSF